MTDVSLKKFDAMGLMDKVKSRGEALFDMRSHENKIYFFTVYFEGILGVVNKDTEYYIDVTSEDTNTGRQERLTSYDEYSHIKDDQVVGKLEELKYKILNNLELN